MKTALLLFSHTVQSLLTLLALIMTAADDKFCNIFQIFEKKRYDILCKQMILMNYHALLLFLKKQQNLKLLSAANYRWRFMG